MPAVRSFVTNMTGMKLRPGLVDPDAAVALGAAVYAGVLSGHISDLMVMEVWQAALMRALADNELKTNKDTRQAVFGKEEDDEAHKSDSDDDSDFDGAIETASGASEVSSGANGQQTKAAKVA